MSITMDVLGFFSKLRKHTSFHRDDSDNDAENSGASASNQNPDREDDGYLLVGQTQSERTTVFAATCSPQGTNSPPDYGQVIDALPSYSSVLNGECTIVSGPSSTVSSSIEFSHLQRQDTLGSRSAICGVPFELHPSLTVHQLADSIFSDMDLEPRSFNWSKYSHDFMNEKLCLRDLNCDEEANIDDFLMPASVSSWSDQHRDSTEEDLIQF